MTSTATTLTVHSCPPGQVRAVLGVIDTHGLDEATHPAGDRITLDAPYQYVGTYGKANDIRDELRRTAPDAAFTVVDDATGEWMGVRYRYVPGLGLHSTTADHEGDPCFLDGEVADLAGAADVKAAVDQLRGTAWTTAIDALTPPDPVDIVEPRRYPVTWDRHTGLIHVEGAAPDGTDLELPRIPGQPDGILRGPADDALTAAGFTRADLWASADRRGRIWETEAYRAADAQPQPSTATTTGAQLDRIARGAR